MGYGSEEITKFDYSKTLTAALIYLMIKQQDAVGLTMFDDKIQTAIKPKSKISQLNLLLKNMHDISTGGETSIPHLLHTLAESIAKRGLVILISDLLDDENEVMNGLRHFKHKGHEVIIFHVIDPKEKNLDFDQNVNFCDIESNSSIMTDTRQIKNQYNKAFNNFCNFYKDNCAKNKIDYIPINTNQPLDVSIMQYLIKRSKLK